jgi:hypothetical protein
MPCLWYILGYNTEGYYQIGLCDNSNTSYNRREEDTTPCSPKCTANDMCLCPVISFANLFICPILSCYASTIATCDGIKCPCKIVKGAPQSIEMTR